MTAGNTRLVPRRVGAAIVVSIMVAAAGCKVQRSEPTWRGIDDDRTCTYYVSGGLFLRDRKTCVSRGREFLCLYDEARNLYDCAATAPTPSEEPWRPTTRP